MKHLLAIAALCLGTACASAPTTIPMVAPLTRSVERVLDRHDMYVGTDPELSSVDMNEALAESAAVRPLLGLPEVPSSVFGDLLGPIMGRHDGYVSGAADLDELEREVYLADTAALRRILAAVPSGALQLP